jgi:hypothetical protein
MSGKYPALDKMMRETFGETLQSNEAGAALRTPSAASRGQQNPLGSFGPLGQMSRTPSNAFQGQQPAQRVSIFDRTPSEIAFEESLEIIIEDDSKGNDAVEKWLPPFVPSWIKHRNAARRKIPFSVLIKSEAKNELRDLDELWDDYNLATNNPRGYIVALLDGKQDMVTLVMNKCGTGIEAYRNVIKCLLLYNLKRIHKIVEWEDTLNAPGIPIYDSSPNNIFKHINVQNIFDVGTLNKHEQEFVRIMNEEAIALYPTVNNQNIKPTSSPFVDMDTFDQVRNDAFFTLTNTNFRIFLNRVSIKYWKLLRYNKQI